MPPPDPQDRRSRFDAIYAAHFDAVRRYARRRTDPEGAEDVVAEVFTTAWRRLDDVPAAAPLPWLYRTAAHVLANERRAAGRAADKARRGAAGKSGVAPDPADALAERDAVVRALAALGEADREALRLVAWEGLSLADAARAAGSSRPAFAMRVYRARRRLAAQLEAPSSAQSLHMEPQT